MPDTDISIKFSRYYFTYIKPVVLFQYSFTSYFLSKLPPFRYSPILKYPNLFHKHPYLLFILHVCLAGKHKPKIQKLYEELEECGRRLMEYKECFEIISLIKGYVIRLKNRDYLLKSKIIPVFSGCHMPISTSVFFYKLP